jgi:hypothetical protein
MFRVGFGEQKEVEEEGWMNGYGWLPGQEHRSAQHAEKEHKDETFDCQFVRGSLYHRSNHIIYAF